MDISSNTPKVHGRALRANPVTISHFLCVPYYYWDVGHPGLVSDPGPDLSTKWISPQIHKKYTGVYFELIRSLLATFYASLTIIGASDVRDWYLIRGRICPPNGYLLKYTGAGLGFDRSKLVLTGTGGLNRLKPVKTGQNCTKLINWPQRLTK